MGIFGQQLSSLAGAATAFGGVYFVFARIDSDQSDDNRRFIRDWLLGVSVDDQKWKLFFEELFARLFGRRQLSLKCVRRSFMFSTTLIVSIYVLWQIIDFGVPITERDFSWFVFLLVIALAIGCITDYLSLWKTRIILTRVKYVRSNFIVVAIVGDFIGTTAIFGGMYILVVAAVLMSTPTVGLDWVSLVRSAMNTSWDFISWLFGDTLPLVPLRPLYYATLLTSAWLWVYLIVAYGMRAVSLLPNWLKPLSKVMDFDNHPVRTIGYVAATFSAAIVLIATMV